MCNVNDEITASYSWLFYFLSVSALDSNSTWSMLFQPTAQSLVSIEHLSIYMYVFVVVVVVVLLAIIAAAGKWRARIKDYNNYG